MECATLCGGDILASERKQWRHARLTGSKKLPSGLLGVSSVQKSLSIVLASNLSTFQFCYKGYKIENETNILNWWNREKFRLFCYHALVLYL